MLCGCSTAYCPDSGTGLGNTCGQGTSSDSSDSSSTTTTTTTTFDGTGQIYASNPSSNSIVRYASASNVTGSVAPSATIAGNVTGLASPGYLTLDTTNDRLYVANTAGNSIQVYDNVSTLTANAAPTRTLSGANTALNGPVQVQLDGTQDLLYVGNSGSDAVTVFSTASSATGNVAPARTLTSSQITGISSIYLDTTNNRLWVVDPTAAALVEFDSASTLSGSPAATRVVSGSSTGLTAPRCLVTGGTNLYVSVTSGILRFAAADTVTGNVAPAASINGTTTDLQSPEQLVYDSASDQLYAADAGASAILIFASASTASGASAPSRLIQGSNSGLSAPSGLALDLTR